MSLGGASASDAVPAAEEKKDNEEDSVISLLHSPLSGVYLQCPLGEAPGCFKAVLVRCLELGEANFLPTNWRGFTEYFRLTELKARSAEELVEAWSGRHPYRREHTLGRVVEYARSKGHRKLLDNFAKTIRG